LKTAECNATGGVPTQLRLNERVVEVAKVEQASS